MQASDVMTRDVITVDPESSIIDAARLMLGKNISGLPVIDSAGNLVGMLTEGDLLRRVETGTQRRRPRWLEFLIGPGSLADEYVHTSSRRAHEIMTPSVYTITEDAALEAVVRQMELHHIKRLPVMRGKALVGLITRANLVRALADTLAKQAPATNDAAIRDRLISELQAQPWAPVGIDVSVNDGVVTLSGIVMDDRERQALRVAAENIPGVKSIKDQIVWIEPMPRTI